mmetsp:Transcript_20222/g.60303  ORF Transcript_20222/g.60303 Transcript_20222/m.60303 type:complete len:301 (-) Transcript_20222:635-1537(-)
MRLVGPPLLLVLAAARVYDGDLDRNLARIGFGRPLARRVRARSDGCAFETPPPGETRARSGAYLAKDVDPRRASGISRPRRSSTRSRVSRDASSRPRGRAELVANIKSRPGEDPPPGRAPLPRKNKRARARVRHLAGLCARHGAAARALRPGPRGGRGAGPGRRGDSIRRGLACLPRQLPVRRGPPRPRGAEAPRRLRPRRRRRGLCQGRGRRLRGRAATARVWDVEKPDGAGRLVGGCQRRGWQLPRRGRRELVQERPDLRRRGDGVRRALPGHGHRVATGPAPRPRGGRQALGPAGYA